MPLPAHQWTAEEIALLGTMPDRKISRRIGLNKLSVAIQRERLGIAPFAGVGAPTKYWTPEREKLLGTMSDGAVVKALNVPGLNRDRVAQRRRSLGIAPFNTRAVAAGLIPIDSGKIREKREALGVSRYALAGQDRALASHLGLMESGKVKAVRPATLEKLCGLLQCEPDAIM